MLHATLTQPRADMVPLSSESLTLAALVEHPFITPGIPQRCYVQGHGPASRCLQVSGTLVTAPGHAGI